MSLLRRLFKREDVEFIHDPRPYDKGKVMRRA